jgi:hypothetical protein
MLDRRFLSAVRVMLAVAGILVLATGVGFAGSLANDQVLIASASPGNLQGSETRLNRDADVKSGPEIALRATHPQSLMLAEAPRGCGPCHVRRYGRCLPCRAVGKVCRNGVCVKP